MNIKKILCLFLILINVGAFTAFAGDVSTYDVLFEEKDPFIIRLADAGLTYTRINEFLTEFDSQAETLQVPEDRESMEKYFLCLLFNVVLENEEYYDVCAVFDGVFQDEFAYMMENDMKLPEAFERFFDVSMENHIKDDIFIPEEEILPEPVEEEKEPEITEEVRKPVFKDMAGYEWASRYVKYLSENKIIEGYEDETFRPSENLTRAEATKIVCTSFLKSGYIVLNSDFDDVTKEQWYYKYVVNAEYYSLFSKMYANNFKSEEYITRQEFCTLAYRAYLKKFGVMNRKVKGIDFFDADNISNFAYTPIITMQKAGVIEGNGNGFFFPQKLITRAEASKIMYLLLN